MKAMILAAGRGERMRPLTDNCPKPLLKIGQYHLIEYHLFALKKAGFKEVVVNHAWLGKQIEAALGDGSRYQLKITYSAEARALETAGGIRQALPLLVTAKQPYFLVINGDIFCDYPFERILQKKLASQAHLVMVDNPRHHPDGDFYLHNHLLSLTPASATTQRLTFSGIGVYHRDFFATLKPEKQALAPLLKQAISNHQVSGEHYHGQWVDVGTPQRLQQLNASALAEI